VDSYGFQKARCNNKKEKTKQKIPYISDTDGVIFEIQIDETKTGLTLQLSIVR
jgi:hypothetical protein